jgi:hypothetical protein
MTADDVELDEFAPDDGALDGIALDDVALGDVAPVEGCAARFSRKAASARCCTSAGAIPGRDAPALGAAFLGADSGTTLAAAAPACAFTGVGGAVFAVAGGCVVLGGTAAWFASDCACGLAVFANNAGGSTKP